MSSKTTASKPTAQTQTQSQAEPNDKAAHEAGKVERLVTKRTLQVPSVGRAVHWNDGQGNLLPATIVAAYPDEESGKVHPHARLLLFVMSKEGSFNAQADHGKDAGQWDWPAYVPPVEVEEEAEEAPTTDQAGNGSETQKPE